MDRMISRIKCQCGRHLVFDGHDASRELTLGKCKCGKYYMFRIANESSNINSEDQSCVKAFNVPGIVLTELLDNSNIFKVELNNFTYDLNSSEDFKILKEPLKRAKDEGKKLVILNLGTDLDLSSCLGPNVGYYMDGFSDDDFIVKGSLDDLVTSDNVFDYLDRLSRDEYFVLVIGSAQADSSSEDILNTVFYDNTPFFIKNGVDRFVGDVCIRGVTSIMDMYGVVENIGLNAIMLMSESIADGVKQVVKEVYLEGN